MQARDLGRAIQDDFVHVLVGLYGAIAIDVLHLDGGIVHENSDRQSQATQRHQVDGLADRAQHNQ